MPNQRALLTAALLLVFSSAALAAPGGRGKEFTALGDQLNEAQRAGNLPLAEELARRRLSVAQGGPERMLGNAYRNLGGVLRLRGKLREAEVMLRQALPLIEKSQGRDSFQAIRTLFNLGALLTVQARYGEAQTLLNDALERQLRSDAADQDTIQLYNALANVARQLGHYAEAESLLQKADATAGTPRDEDDKGHRDEFSLRRLRLHTVMNRAQLHYHQGRYADATTLAQRAMAGFAQLEGDTHPDYASAQTLLGLSLLQLAERREEAERVLRAAVALDERVLGRAHRETGRAVWGLALALQKNGKGDEAEPLLRRAIDSSQGAGATSQQAIDERSYARLLSQQKRYAEALTHYRQALDLIDRMFAQTRGLDDATREGFIAQFAPYYGETLQLLLRLHHLHPDAGHDRQALAIVSRTQSRLFTEMLRKSDAGQRSSDPEFVALRRRQDELNEHLAELQRARTVSDQYGESEEGDAAEARRRNLDPIVMARVADYRQELEADVGTTTAELARIESELWRRNPRYMELTQPRPVSVDALQKTLLRPGETLVSYYLLADRVLIFFVERDRFRLHEVARPRREIAALIDAVRRPEETAGAAVGNLSALDPQALYSLYQALFAPFAGELKAGQRLLVIGDGPLHTLPLEMLIERWGEAEQRAFAAARAAGQPRLGEYATLPYLAHKYRFAYLPSLASLASIRLYRKPAVRYERELVSFADPVFEKNGYAANTQAALTTLTRAVAPGRRLEIPRLPETADEAREIAAILAGKAGTAGRSEVYLRERAQEHAAKTLDLKTTRYLHFATHGLLGGEFVAVRDALATNELAGEDSQRNLNVQATGRPAAASAATAANPAAAESAESDEPAPRPYVDRGQPALLLSLSGDMQGEDGLLTMGEVIEALDLNARLVVLSACNTAGENRAASSGEGFAGLTRAFMYAGAQGILVSHWSVESRATQLLMSELFRNLSRDAQEDSLAALENARAHIRNSRDTAQGGLSRAHPYFWAPFVYVGD